MENQGASESTPENGLGVARTLGFIPMFLLVVIMILRISWLLYRNTVDNVIITITFVIICVTHLFVCISLIAASVAVRGWRQLWSDLSNISMAVELVELICVILVPIVTYLLYLLTFLIFYWIKLIRTRQKTRTSQQRRVYVGSRTRQLSDQEPSIFVSPANLPPPPKYEVMAPPSYEEVMGVHYPGYAQQPITQPLTHALAQSPSTADRTREAASNVTGANNSAPCPVHTVVTVTNERSSEVRS